MDTERDANGDLQWGPNFPTGDTLGEFIHSKGFKFGMYLSAGPKTCSLNTCSHSSDPECVVNRTATGWGSYSDDGSVEMRDAKWIAKQGADYLKYDGVCGGDFGAPPLNASFGILETSTSRSLDLEDASEVLGGLGVSGRLPDDLINLIFIW